MGSDKNLSIGAISRATEIPEATLRTWERRYGFPEPIRLPSGHRRYSAATVPKLRLMAAAKDAGMQPSESAELSVDELRAFLGLDAVRRLPTGQSWIEQIRAMDDAAFDAHLKRELTRLGVDRYVQDVVGPLTQFIGEAWADGRLSVAEEHWASERIRQSLSSQWTAMAAQNSGPPYICATLPGEQHDLGLQMAATVLAVHGARVVYLGANTPLDSIIKTAEDRNAACVCVSVSAAAPPLQTRGLINTLREQLPLRYGLILGGAGGFEADGAELVKEWDELVADVRNRDRNSQQG